jgi:hypothetical protein
MKKIFLALALTIASTQAFSVASQLGMIQGDIRISLGSALTTSTTFGFTNALIGLVALADNGEAYINIAAPEAKEAVKLAVQKSVEGEKLSTEESSLITIYAQHLNMSEKAFIDSVAQEL